MAITSLAPDVYVDVQDLSQYVDSVPSTWGFLPIICEKGPDNVIERFSRSDFLDTFGEPNINYTNNAQFGMGPYVAEQFLSESDTLFVIRCLPDDAQFANIAIKMFGFDTTGDTTSMWYDESGVAQSQDTTGGSAFEVTLYSYSYGDKVLDTTTSFPWEPSALNSYNELQQTVQAGAVIDVYGTDSPALDLDPSSSFGADYDDADDLPDPTLLLFYGVGRGAYYNNYQVDLNKHPLKELRDLGVYVLDVYKRQSFSQRFSNASSNSIFNQFLDYELIESFEVAFDPEQKDNGGNSIFIEDVLNSFSDSIKVITNRVLLTEIARRENLDETGPDKLIINWEQGFKTTTNNFNPYNITDSTGGYTPEYLSFLSDLSGLNETIDQVVSHGVNLRNGTDGGIFTRTKLTGTNTYVWMLDSTVSTQILADAYLGRLKNIWLPVDADDDNDDPDERVEGVLDTENFPFDVVFDAGYPGDVKDAISTLVNTRRDCMAFMDNGDSKSAKLALRARDPLFANEGLIRNTSGYNSRYVALYEPYTKIYDSWTGKDLWVPPTYHVSRIIGYSDRNNEIWYPLAGFNRATINVIKSMRYNPSLSDRDQFIRQQLNPIVRFADGYALFSQRTTQRQPSALQDINVVRLVLYIERALKRFCRGFIFELNLPETWAKISQEVDAFLRDVQDRRGLYGYTVTVGANDYDIRMRRVNVDVILRPVRAIEQINLTFFVS